jgi:hypothetical protein
MPLFDLRQRALLVSVLIDWLALMRDIEESPA